MVRFNSMPKPLQFRSGAIIYFQGDPADKIFILQTGSVNLVYKDIETGDDVSDLVRSGEFFGVKSALGRFPREESAVASKDATLMSFTVPEFEAMAIANTRIVMKMLKVFSDQLRKVHRQVASLMEKEDQQDPEAGLFNLGEYYFKAKKYDNARYVFSRYLTYYPSGKNAQSAANLLQNSEKLAAEAGASRPFRASPVKETQNTEQAASNTMETASAKAYNDAVSLVSQQKYQQAYLAFRKIVDANEDADYIAKSTFESGRCLFFLNKFEDCIQLYTAMLTKYPRHTGMHDALFFMGQSYEKSKNKEQAIAIYKKILSMPGITDDQIHVKARQALRTLEG